MTSCTASAAAQAVGVADVGVAVLELAAARLEGVDDALLDEDAADRLVAAAEALGDGDQVGHARPPARVA